MKIISVRGRQGMGKGRVASALSAELRECGFTVTHCNEMLPGALAKAIRIGNDYVVVEVQAESDICIHTEDV